MGAGGGAVLLALHKGLQTPLGPCLMAGASPTLVGPGQAWLRLWGSRVRLLPILCHRVTP